MKLFFVTVLSLLMATAVAQPTRKTAVKEKPPTQTEIDKMMSEAMKDLSAEEKKMVQESLQAVKQMEEKGIKINSGDDIPRIPKKQVQLLSSIPTISSTQQYAAYLASLLATCKKKVPASIISEVDKLFVSKGSDWEALANAGPLLLLQQRPDAAVYAALKTAMSHPDVVLLQDNLAVILHQTGNAHKAIPILNYLVKQNDHPVILNNIAQSYLSLGDTANARKYFMGCLRKDPNHCEANCGMGLLLTEAGKTHEADPYIIKSLKNGYTETADALATKNKTKLKFSEIKQEVPEYFNPQKFKPVPPAYDFRSVEPTELLRTEMEMTMRFWVNESIRIHDEQSNKMESENMMQLMDRSKGLFSNAPFAKKAKLMVNLLGIEYAEFIAEDKKNYYLAIQKDLNEQLRKNLTAMYGGNQEYASTYEDCLKKIEILNLHLSLSAKNHEAYQRATLPKVHEWVNQSLYWWAFLMNKEQYGLFFHYLVSDFFEAMHDYDQMQILHPTPLWIWNTCKDVTEPVKGKEAVIDSLEPLDCPVKVEIPFGVGKGKLDCEGFEIEGGELIMVGFEKNFRSGEMTFFLGLGVELFAKGAVVGGIEGGAKIGSFVKVGKDGSIIDIGDKAEIGVEGGVGPFMVEKKLTGVMGMQSGIKVSVSGEDKPIFEYGTEK